LILTEFFDIVHMYGWCDHITVFDTRIVVSILFL